MSFSSTIRNVKLVENEAIGSRGDGDDDDVAAKLKLNDLPDDCLSEIATHLEDIVDNVNLGKTDKRIEKFVRMWCQSSVNRRFTYGDEL